MRDKEYKIEDRMKIKNIKIKMQDEMDIGNKKINKG